MDKDTLHEIDEIMVDKVSVAFCLALGNLCFVASFLKVMTLVLIAPIIAVVTFLVAAGKKGNCWSLTIMLRNRWNIYWG